MQSYYGPPVSHLPKQIHHGLGFFEECLKEKVIVVPGIFFDINPSKRRDLFDSPCHHFVRISYGPRMDLLEKGLDGIERVLKKYVFTIRGWSGIGMLTDGMGVLNRHGYRGESGESGESVVWREDEDEYL